MQRSTRNSRSAVHRASPMVAGLVLIIGLSLLMSACGNGGYDGDAAGSAVNGRQQTTTVAGEAAPPDLELDEQCYNEESGLAVSYPEGWHTNDGPEGLECRYFHPEEFAVDEAGDAPEASVRMRLVSGTPEQNAEAFAQGAPGDESREDVTIDGRDAIVTEHESTGDDLLPKGTRTKRYLVDLNGTTLVAAARDVEGVDFDETQSVLEAMIGSAEIVHAG